MCYSPESRCAFLSESELLAFSTQLANRIKVCVRRGSIVFGAVRLMPPKRVALHEKGVLSRTSLSIDRPTSADGGVAGSSGERIDRLTRLKV